MDNLRRRTWFIDKDDIPKSAKKFDINQDISGNVIYIPLFEDNYMYINGSKYSYGSLYLFKDNFYRFDNINNITAGYPLSTGYSYRFYFDKRGTDRWIEIVYPTMVGLNNYTRYTYHISTNDSTFGSDTITGGYFGNTKKTGGTLTFYTFSGTSSSGTYSPVKVFPEAYIKIKLSETVTPCIHTATSPYTYISSNSNILSFDFEYPVYIDTE